MKLEIHNKIISKEIEKKYAELENKKGFEEAINHIVSTTMKDDSCNTLQKLGAFAIKENPHLAMEVLVKQDPRIAMDFAVLGVLEITGKVIGSNQNNIGVNILKYIEGDDTHGIQSIRKGK